MSPEPVEPACKKSGGPDSLVLGLMTKYWDAGKVKTRLGASIGMQRAADLHRLFVSHLCRSLADVGDQRIACLSPDPRDGRFEAELRSWGLEESWATIPQGEGSLGERMERWFMHCFSHPVSEYAAAWSEPSMAILIGGDCPVLDAHHLQLAAQVLRKRDVVLGPAADGGYYLIGIRGPWRAKQAEFESLFRNIPWSTPQVLAVTRRRAESAGLPLSELEIREDVDTVVELNRLREFLSAKSFAYNDNRVQVGTTSLATLKTEIDRIMGEGSLGLESSDKGPR